MAHWKPGKRHVIPHRRFYIDEDTWSILLGDGWDANGKLWKHYYGLPLLAPDIPGLITMAHVYNNVQTGAWGIAALFEATPGAQVRPSTPRTITTLLQMLCPPAVSDSLRRARDSLRRARAHRGARLILDVCLLLSAALPSLATSLDPLDRRAVTMAHPERGVLLSVATVGRRLVAVGAAGVIIISDDFGSTWSQVSTPVSVTLTSVVFANERVGWAVGHSGVILGTQDSGATWTRQYDGRETIAALKSRVESADPGASSEKEDLDSLRQMVR